MQVHETNRKLSMIFHQMAECYRYLGSSERFRANAYANAARVLLNMQEDVGRYINNPKALDDIKGIGESITEKIIEFLNTGTVTTFETLKTKVPYDLLELMELSGFGPATLQKLHKELNISSRSDLVKAINTGRLEGLKGFGTERILTLKKVLKLDEKSTRTPLREVEKRANEILQVIQKIRGVEKVIIAGSIRRRKETIGDIDMLVQTELNQRKKVVTLLLNHLPIAKVLAKGITKLSMILSGHAMQLDIRLVTRDEFGAALLYLTGSKEHNIRLRTLARERGYKINEYGLFDIKTGKKIAGKTEEDMYAALQMRYIPPEQRVNNGEIERADLRVKETA